MSGLDPEQYDIVKAHEVKVGDFIFMFTGDVCVTNAEIIDDFVLFEYTRDANVVGARIKSFGAPMHRRKEQ